MIFLIFVCILISLVFALIFIIKDKGLLDRSLIALIIRISLSLSLFIFLLLMHKIGFI
ncbi:MAG: DUF2909 family protein [Bordetella sp.]|nr:MAG: DUF2909 family protein [Bordetella sp.]